ncbi:tetratricopeptide repeat protein 29 [Trichomycterus rosablanca]|uniref:tetratricopeptide repeat protein 29 n=1 Tax=Trichomycterus rosablanca TaxID=2290929 RepID=UPI002F35E800
MTSGMMQKTRFLPDINRKNNVRSSHQWKKEMKEPNQGSAVREKKQSSTVTENDIAQFRNGLHQNLCVSMLQEGFHRSFEELFSLLKHWSTNRLAAGPDSSLWLQPSLEEQPHKLEMLKKHLTRAEATQRADQYEEVNENYLALAKFFSEPEDRWLRLHFYKLSLVAACKVKLDSGRKEAEANAYLGQVYQEQGDLELAREHLEVFHHMAVGRPWQDKSGQTHQSKACKKLCRVYMLLAQGHLQSKEYRPAIDMLNKAYELAKEGGDKKMEAEAAYTVGLAYQSTGDRRTARQFLNISVEIYTTLEDPGSLGKTYQAIAESLGSEGKVNESIQYLQKYAEISQKSDHHQNLQDACMSLGFIHISNGQYDSAHKCFDQAYDMAGSLDSVAQLQKAQVYVGIARAHAMLSAYTTHIKMDKPENIHTLIHWKGTQKFNMS